jgi:uncharacterized protein YodC (DUF2158 family)
MATKFKKGEPVRLKTVVPAGPVEALRMDEDGNVFCLLKWQDENGSAQERWFAEDVLISGE